MKLQPNKKYTTIAIYAFLVIAAAIALFYLINEHATVGRVIGTFVSLMMPFIYGAALAYILNPVLNWLEKKVFPSLFGERLSRRARRRIGVLISFIFAAAVVAIFLAILIPQIVESINSLAQSIYAFLPQAQQTLNEWTAKYGSNELLLNVLEILGIDVSDPSLALQRLATRSYTFLTQVLPNLFGGVMRFTSGLLNVVVGIIIAVYLLLSKEVFYAQVKKLMFAFFPRRAAQAVLNLTHDSNAIFCGFISGKIVDSASIFIIMIDLPIKSLIFAVFILVLQQLDGNVIGPKILGDSTGLSAFWVLFAVTFFGGLFGFVGMLIGVPTFAVIYSLIRNIAEYKLGKKGMKTQTPDYAAQDCPIFQKVDYHEGEMAPRSCVEVCDLDGKHPETPEQQAAYMADSSKEEEDR